MEVYWIWLSMVRGVGPVTLRKLIDAFGTPLRVYNATPDDFFKFPGIRQSVIDSIISSRSLDSAKCLQEKMYNSDIKLYTYTQPDYPSGLNIDPSLPAILYCRGIMKESAQSIGIVGSRRCTSYGKEVAAEAAAYLGHQGVTVVSGLAKGIDSYAHTACLKAGGHTLALVANGPEICYPPEHQGLMNEIINNGAIISPFPPGTRPRQEYFPLRNQILSAWVCKLLVVEAAERSGALITAKYAIQYGRKVYAVPNSIYAAESKGTNSLLLNGALIYLAPEQLADKKIASINAQTQMSQAKVNSTRPAKNALLEGEEWIMSQLEKAKKVDDLQMKYPGDSKDFLASLVQLEILGNIIVSGQWVKRI